MQYSQRTSISLRKNCLIPFQAIFRISFNGIPQGLYRGLTIIAEF